MPESNVFVRGNALSGLSETQVGGESVLDTYERVIPRLRALAGDEAAALFARPAVMRGNGETQTSVSWYVPRAGAVRAWSALSADERIQVGAEIRSRLDRLRAAFDDPEIGDTVQSWLAIPSLEQDLVLVGGEPHLLNWGLVPESVADDASARHAHFRRTLGLFGAEETSSPRIGSRAASAG
ncbi:hypothetical protein ACTZWW_19705, partial [Salinarimonas sp. NSM]|uniref:hypothetical protein n=1 Tax=Salinarimonas sp. NSM TaxID=3458003 RepID=UPI0040352C4E